MYTYEKGTQTEAVVLSALAKAGYTVLLPFGVTRYDLAIDLGNGAGIKTVQCKTGRLRNGTILWNAHSSHTITHARTTYRGQVDYFGVWCPAFPEDVFLVPVDAVTGFEGRLRVTETKINFGRERFQWADDFKVKPIQTGEQEIAGPNPVTPTKPL